MRIETVTSNAFERLESLATGASCIRAVMAYWTIPAPDLPHQLLSGMSAQSGFLCVDIHNPTSIEALKSLHNAGVSVNLHLVSTTGKSEIDDSTGMPNHLMHSKVIVFDFEGRDSVLWVGSHNGTFRALDGINFECSLAVHASTDSEVYKEVLGHVLDIHRACKPFDPALMAHYRYLQGSKLDNAVSVMEFENGNDLPLQVNDEISVFNMSRDDLRSFKTIDTEVIVSLHGSEEILYEAKVVQTGETPTQKSQSFSDRRHADRNRAQLPVLLAKTPVTPAMYKRGSYFSIVKIVKQIDTAFHLLEIPTQSAWIDATATEVLKCTQVDEVSTIKRGARSVRPKGLTFKVPAFEEMVSSDMVVSAEIEDLRMMAFREMRLEEKRVVKRPVLIKKKLLVRQ
jgi:hypothetical protein